MVDNTRRPHGGETWHRLLEWDIGQAASERMAASLLTSEGFSVDPSHPLGGQDGGKDCICHKDGVTLIGAFYFPRGQQSFAEIRQKFNSDLDGVARSDAKGMVFVTNQEIQLAQRKTLLDLADTNIIEIYHLERLTTLLNSPTHYGLRLEFLNISITQEEYLSFIANRDQEHFQQLQRISTSVESVLTDLRKQSTDLIGYSTGEGSLVYCRPANYVNTKIVQMMLFHEGQYPVFDIRCEWIDVAEEVNPEHGMTYTRHTKFIPHLYPNKIITDLFRFDLSERSELRINLFINTRTSGLTQQFKFVRVDDKILMAHMTHPEGILEASIPAAMPGYDADNPESIFHRP